jgi:glyoxylase-like metal-dependent hydrolase (beta-lactamase superfamily II)/rhodanese-related sulfurtransferase
VLVVPLLHPQGCRSYLVADPATRQAAAVDVHLDSVAEAAARVTQEGLDLQWVVDTHTHADHPSGAKRLAEWFGATRVAHAAARHAGTTLHPKDGETVALGGRSLRFLHAPGHTPDHLVVVADGNLFSGDTLLIGSVARTDFLGGDAGELWDTIHRLLRELPPDTVLYPGHDYRGKVLSTLREERAGNPWLALPGREEFVRRLTANPPPRPANMDDLLRLNRDGVEIPPRVPASVAIARVKAGGAGSVIDVRTDLEVQTQGVPGARHVVLDQITARADEVRATPAPRLLLCRTGNRAGKAQQALDALGIQGLSVIEGGIEAYAAGGGETVEPRKVISLERQVRIAAGLLVTIGVALGLLVTPWLSLFSALIGLGLVYAGVSNRCGMALVLAKLPWNKMAPAPAPPPSGGCSAGGCSAGSPPP